MIKVSDKNKEIILKLVEKGIIPRSNYTVDEKLLLLHRQIYSTYGQGKTSSFKQARRYAGLGFIWHKRFILELNYTEIPEGFVYVISNPAWPSMRKVGFTLDPIKRLNQYQTYDPYRSYILESYEFVLNKRYVEQKTLNIFKNKEEGVGEWVSTDKSEELIHSIRKDIELIQEEIYYDKFNKLIKVGHVIKTSKGLKYKVLGFSSGGVKTNNNKIFPLDQIEVI